MLRVDCRVQGATTPEIRQFHGVIPTSMGIIPRLFPKASASCPCSSDLGGMRIGKVHASSKAELPAVTISRRSPISASPVLDAVADGAQFRDRITHEAKASPDANSRGCAA
jgi:hypothetical protein